MNLKVEDYYPSGKRFLLRFKEKGGKEKELPVHHKLEELLDRFDGQFKSDLEQVIRFHHPGFDPARFTSFSNVEQLLSEMQVNEQLFNASRQYEGKFTKAKLKTLQRDLLLEIADWFHEISTSVKPSATRIKWLKKFRDQVNAENAAIISFNWDLILHELLFGDEIDGTSYGFVETKKDAAILLEPHGSLNWFEDKQGTFLKSDKSEPIFGERGNEAIYAFLRFRAPVSNSGRIYIPLIIPPVYLKNFEKPVFRVLWNNCTAALSKAKKVVFLGYSMPTADLHAQFILRCGFHNQHEGELTKAKKRKTATGPAKVIIVNPDPGAANRIPAIAEPTHQCEWISTPVGDWIEAE